MDQLNLELPINSLSLGQMGWGVAYEIYSRGWTPNIFPIGPIDLRSFQPDAKFEHWLNTCARKAVREFDRSQKNICLWHIHGSHKVLTDNTVLWTPYEASEPTVAELNIVKAYKHVAFTSSYAANLFTKAGASNVAHVPNFFDAIHLRSLQTGYKSQHITFSLIGKMEKRKHTRNILIAWANLFANKPEYRLNCCIFNPFLDPQQQGQEIESWFGGRVPANINFLPFQERNSDFNKVINDTDISISGLSGAEGFGLPAFNDLCLGKVCVFLNAHAHKDFADDNNAVLVEPSGMEEIYDGRFFQKGADFNQGSIFTFTQEAAHAAFKKAVDIYKNSDKLESRPDLIEKFSVKNTVDKLITL